MSEFNETLTQGLSVAAAINPQTLNNSSATSAGVNMSQAKRVMVVGLVGTVTGGGSLTAKLQTSATLGGSYVDVPGSTITAITTGTKQFTIEIRGDQVISLATAGQIFVRASLTEGGSQNVVCSAAVLLGQSVQKPCSQYDPATVVQRLVL